MIKITRLIIGFVLIWSVLFSTVTSVRAEKSDLVLDARTRVALRAAELAVKSMPGEYSWEEYRSCSSFASAYLRQLSFPVDGVDDQYAKYPDPFPWSSVISQVNWIQRNAQTSFHEAPLIDFLDQELWEEIKPGSLVYLQTAEGHNGYNTYYHVVVLVGYRADGSPQFAEIAPGNSASSDRTFEEVVSFYHKDGNGNWIIRPYKTGSSEEVVLKVSWFDPLEYLNTGLWLKKGRVIPNSPFLDDAFQTIVTVNVYDGTTAIFEKTTTDSGTDWKPVRIKGREEFYAVVGRLLPANKDIGETFFLGHEDSLYDSDFGVYISKNGVYQHSWTPQLIAKLESFDYVSGFGGLNGATDTAIMMPLVIEKKGMLGKAIDYSPFTIHRIPDVVNQDILLRKDLLGKANTLFGEDYGPIPVPQVNLSSGCVNYDKETWALFKGYLQNRLGDGVGVVLSYPDFDQNLIFGTDLFTNPFIGPMFYQWCPESGDVMCDSIDRRYYRDTYLNSDGM
ncbi:MAG TPA: hypothetical protein VLH94_01815 [Spirochaetia bacterium]|nr:hypothetical protein [Spirochaetia bacterium]